MTYKWWEIKGNEGRSLSLRKYKTPAFVTVMDPSVVGDHLDRAGLSGEFFLVEF